MDIEFEFFEPEEKYGPIKATVHKSGKLGFSQGAAKLIDFETNPLFKIGRKKTEPGDQSEIYMIPVQTEDEQTFKVLKAGGYYYLKVRRLLTQMGIDYRTEGESVSFEIDEMKKDGKTYFKLLRKMRKPDKLPVKTGGGD